MTTAPLPALGREQPLEAFYVPKFKLTLLTQSNSPRVVVVEGDVKRDVLYDVESITYVDNVEEADSFSLTINNWNAQDRKLKYVGYQTKPADDPEKTWAELFEPGQRMELWLGYGNDLRLMMRGYITTFDVTFPQSGAVTLKVEAQDVARKLTAMKFSDRWADKRDSEIAKELEKAPTRAHPGLGFPIKISDSAKSKEAKHPRVVMRSQQIMEFLLERAKRHCYSVFRMVEGKKEFLYFGPSEELPDGPYTLEWGKTLLEFHPTLKVAKEAKSVTVRNWDKGERKKLTATADLSKEGLNKDLHPFLDAVGEEKQVIDRSLRTLDQCKELARSTLVCTLKALVTATGATVGLPDLRAGQVIHIKGVDYRFNGRYFVLQTTHTFDTNGYRTTFKARREEPRQQ